MLPSTLVKQKIKTHYVKYPNQADVKIIFVKYPNEADLKVHFVKYKNQAGWKVSHEWNGRIR